MTLEQLMNDSENLLIWKYYLLTNNPLFSPVCSMALMKNFVGKEDIAQNEQFLHCLQCFLSISPFPQENYNLVESVFQLSSANFFQYARAQSFLFGKELRTAL